jgi:hypothetical protein
MFWILANLVLQYKIITPKIKWHCSFFSKKSKIKHKIKEIRGKKHLKTEKKHLYT